MLAVLERVDSGLTSVQIVFDSQISGIFLEQLFSDPELPVRGELFIEHQIG